MGQGDGTVDWRLHRLDRHSLRAERQGRTSAEHITPEPSWERVDVAHTRHNHYNVSHVSPHDL